MTIEMPRVELPVVEEMQLEIARGFATLQARRAEGKPVVWTSLLLPREIFLAMDVATVYGDLLGGNIGVFQVSGKYCQVAEDTGLSRDVCAVHRGALGLAFAEGDDDLFRMAFAPPDLVVASNFPCMSYSKSALHVARKYNAPFHFLDTPINTWGADIPERAVAYFADQIRRTIDFLVAHGYRFDLERLKEEVAFTRQLNTLLDEIDTYKRATPAPMKPYDSAVAATTPLQVTDKPRMLELFTRLRDALKDRVERGVGIVEREDLRLFWIGNPPIVDFNVLSYPERRNVVIAKGLLELLTGFNLDPRLMDPDKPVESLARAYLHSPANPTHEGLLNYFLTTVRDYRIDGIVSVVKRSCAFLPGSIRLSKDEIYARTGVPTVVFNCEGSDQREYDPTEVRANLDTFIDTLLARKGSRDGSRPTA